MASVPESVAAEFLRRIRSKRLRDEAEMLEAQSEGLGTEATKRRKVADSLDSGSRILADYEKAREKARAEGAKRKEQLLRGADLGTQQVNPENATGALRTDVNFGRDLGTVGPEGAIGGQAVQAGGGLQQMVQQAQGAVQPNITTEQQTTSVAPQQVAPGVFLPVERQQTTVRNVPNVVTANQALASTISRQNAELRARNRLLIEREKQLDSEIEIQAEGLGNLVAQEQLGFGDHGIEEAQTAILNNFGPEVGLRIIARARAKAQQEASEFRREARLKSIGSDPEFLKVLNRLDRAKPGTLEHLALTAKVQDMTDDRLQYDSATGSWSVRPPQRKPEINAQIKNLQESLASVDRGLDVVGELEGAIRADPSIVGPIGTGRRAYQFTTQFASEFSRSVKTLFDRDVGFGFIPEEETDEIRNRFFNPNLPRLQQLENEIAYLKARVRRPSRTALVDVESARKELGITHPINTAAHILTNLQETRQEFQERRSSIVQLLSDAGATPVGGVAVTPTLEPGEEPIRGSGATGTWRIDLSTGKRTKVR